MYHHYTDELTMESLIDDDDIDSFELTPLPFLCVLLAIIRRTTTKQTRAANAAANTTNVVPIGVRLFDDFYVSREFESTPSTFGIN